MECSVHCFCSSAELKSILNEEQASSRLNKDKRKTIYRNISLFLSPAAISRELIVDIPSCVIAKVRSAYPDKKYSSFKAYSTHLNK